MKDSPYVSTTNACKLCTPIGAAMAFKGVEGCVPFLHGSQGCATYMRRYIISHFREPMDIASSALGEKQAVFGGGPNLKKGLLNVMRKYGASCVGVATTCLTETIGDDVPMLVHEFKKEFGDLPLAEIVHCSTPSYQGTHMDGWHAATKALAEQLVEQNPAPDAAASVNIIPGFVSPEDLRHLQELALDFGLRPTLLPDISDTLDGQALLDYEKIPSGGTPLEAIRAMGAAGGTLEFGHCIMGRRTASDLIRERCGVRLHAMGLPIGVRGSDALMDALEEIAGRPAPLRHQKERGRLVDAMVDGHKYISGKRVVVYGEEDMTIGLASFLAELGMHVVLVATGARNPGYRRLLLEAMAPHARHEPDIRQGVDFYDIAEIARDMQPDLLIGHSKGYRYARQWGVPLVRVGFPVHDRFGGARLQHLGYRGALALLDRIVNAVLERNQDDSPVGYGYL